MSNELRFAYGTTGRTVTALLFDASGNVWNGSAFVSRLPSRRQPGQMEQSPALSK